MSQWIKTKDRLPERYYHAVLVWVENERCGTYAVGYVIEDDPNWYEWLSDEPFEDFTVVAWQELPDEYREEK